MRTGPVCLVVRSDSVGLLCTVKFSSARAAERRICAHACTSVCVCSPYLGPPCTRLAAIVGTPWRPSASRCIVCVWAAEWQSLALVRAKRAGVVADAVLCVSFFHGHAPRQCDVKRPPVKAGRGSARTSGSVLCERMKMVCDVYARSTGF